ncbi:MAG: glutamate racemase [Flavobacteriaceae bacterium]
MNRPIGLFDSGIGGMSLLPAIEALLPLESICYIADHAYSPYGDKSLEVVLNRARVITEKLLQLDCKLIVLACNTATTQIIDQLRAEFPVSFVGIEPAIKPAALVTKTRKVGVLATKGTLESELFHQSVIEHGSGIDIVKQIGKGLVACVETGKREDQATKMLLKSHLEPMIAKGIDTLVLGCTHYPFLINTIEEILPSGVKIIDNSQAIANQIKRLLEKENNLSKKGKEKKRQFYSTQKENNLGLFTSALVKYLPL